MTTIRLFSLSVLLLLAGCATQAPLIWKANDLAALNAPQIRLNRQSDGKTIGMIQRERVQRLIAIKDRISAVAGRSAELLIVSGKEPNAFATYLQGRPVIGVNLGMIDMFGSDDDAYAAILGHEFAHLILGHGAIRKEREQTRSAASTILGNVLGLAGVPMGGIIANVTTTAVSTVYSRDEERDADRDGMDYMKRAGFDPKGAVRAWDRMSKVSGFSIPFLSTHPTSTERLETMKRLAEQ